MSPSKEFLDALRKYDDYLIVAHENPDADSIGSMLGLYLGLKQLGKRCRVVTSDPIPSSLVWPHIDEIEGHSSIEDWDFRALIVLDCEITRTGSLKDFVTTIPVIFNVDHHPGNSQHADYKYHDSTEPATASMVYKILKGLDIAITPAIAYNVYGGIFGDTGGFRYANTTSEVLLVASELVELGADPAKISREIFETKSWNFMKLLGHALNNMEKNSSGEVAWMKLSNEDFRNFGVDPRETDQLVHYARMIEGDQIALLFRETEPNEVRIGFRSHQYDVRSLATKLGGGGHKLAAGARVSGELSSVIQQVVTETEKLLAHFRR